MINDFAKWVEIYHNKKLTLEQARYAEHLFGQKEFVLGGRKAGRKEVAEWVRGYKASSFYADEFVGMGVFELYLYVPNRDSIHKDPVDETKCRHRVLDDLCVRQCRCPATEMVRGFKFCPQHARLLRKRFNDDQAEG